jgi:hypothetical protein
MVNALDAFRAELGASVLIEAGSVRVLGHPV